MRRISSGRFYVDSNAAFHSVSFQVGSSYSIHARTIPRRSIVRGYIAFRSTRRDLAPRGAHPALVKTLTFLRYESARFQINNSRRKLNCGDPLIARLDAQSRIMAVAYKYFSAKYLRFDSSRLINGKFLPSNSIK